MFGFSRKKQRASRFKRKALSYMTRWHIARKAYFALRYFLYSFMADMNCVLVLFICSRVWSIETSVRFMASSQ
mgnify:CR=1 FL=1